MKKKKARKPAVEAAPIQSTPVKPPVPAISKRPTILELEAILNAEEESTIEILPNGEVRSVSAEEIAKRPKTKPLTMRENLGGEYGEVA